MESFYGGPKGIDFEIKQIFTSKYQMDRDLTKGWTSSIFPGDFVIVSYGLPSDANYDIYKNEDLQNYGKSYNSTLWKKVFNDKDGSGSAGGLSYEMQASMTGNTPRISLHDTEVLDADKDPNVIWDNTDLDRLWLTFQLPQSQNIQLGETTVLDCDKSPSAELDTTDINNPSLKLSLPQSQVIETALVELLNVGEEPTVSLETSGSYSINRPAIKFQLPVSQSLQEGTTTVLDSNETPYFEINFDDINNPVINFFLPQSQVMGNPETIIVGPEENPSVQIDNTNINSPVLKFSLPESIKFYYGELLGERTAGTYEETNEAFADYNIGDYYINAPTGFIYKVTKKSDTTCTFQYVACIQSPLPEIEVTKLDPYTNGGSGYEPTAPTVVREFTNTEETAWKLVFGLPSAVKYGVSFNFIGIDEEGSVSSKIISSDTVNLDFQIPRGSKLFAGLTVSDTSLNVTVDGAKTGDLYLNTDTGDIYSLGSNGTWVKNKGNLKGPVGEALKIVKSYTINETETIKDSLQNGVNYIEENYDGEISAEDIFSITWVEYETNQETSYWYYKAADGVWGRVQLTGGIANLIDNDYNNEDGGEVTNKTYSVHYINTLIGGAITNKDRQTYSAEQIEELLSWGSFSDLIP